MLNTVAIESDPSALETKPFDVRTPSGREENAVGGEALEFAVVAHRYRAPVAVAFDRRDRRIDDDTDVFFAECRGDRHADVGVFRTQKRRCILHERDLCA